MTVKKDTVIWILIKSIETLLFIYLVPGLTYFFLISFAMILEIQSNV